MAFVSEDCIKEWTTKNSWVYINFSYLFCNKLWSKRIPKGFSLCPYFWTAIFSMFIFKPLIEPTLLGLGWCLKQIFRIGGAPILWWDNFMIKNVCEKIYFPTYKGSGLVASFLSSLLVIAAGLTIFLLHMFYTRVVASVPACVVMFWYTLANFTFIIPTSIYIAKNRGREDRCKVEWYNLLFFIVSTVALAIMYPSMMGGGMEIMGSFFRTLGHGIAVGFSSIWWALGVSLSFLGHYGWIALKYAGKMLLTGVIMLVPIVIFLAVLGGMGMILMKMCDKLMVAQAEDVNKVRKVTKEDWQSLLYQVFSENYWMEYLINLPRDNFDHYYSSIYESSKRYDLVIAYTERELVRLIVNRTDIPESLLNMPYTSFESLKSSIYSDWKNKNGKWTLLYNRATLMGSEIYTDLIKTKEAITSFIYSDIRTYSLFEKHLKSDYDKEIAAVNQEVGKIIESLKAEIARREALKKKHNEMCQKVSGPIANFFISMGKGIRFICSLIFVKFIWDMVIIKGVCFTFRQIKIFFIYMWVVLKHLKHGACPYLMFTDPVVEVKNVTEEKK